MARSCGQIGPTIYVFCRFMSRSGIFGGCLNLGKSHTFFPDFRIHIFPYTYVYIQCAARITRHRAFAKSRFLGLFSVPFSRFSRGVGSCFSRCWRLQTMFFRNFRGSGPSRVPILRIFGIYVISGTFPRRKSSPHFEAWGALRTRFWGLDF